MKVARKLSGNFSRRLAIACALAVASGAPVAAWAQARPYPTRTISLVVPYAPGGITDVIARMMATPLSRELGQPIIIENVTGAGGNLGSMRVASAEPDGYSLLITQTSTVTNPLLERNVKFDPSTSFTHVAYLGSLPLWLLVNPSASRYGSLDALVKTMRQYPGKLNYGSGGTGSASHLGVAYFEAVEKVDAQHVPYRGMSAALADLMAGLVDFALTPVAGSESLVKSGKLKALAISGGRLKAFAEVPTFAEAGCPRMDVTGWVGISGPAGLPADIAGRLHIAVTKVLADPAMQQALLDRTLVVKPGTSAEFAVFVRSESRRWGELIARTGIKAD